MKYFGKATKKPVEIDWFFWGGDAAALMGWVTSFGESFMGNFSYLNKKLKVLTLEGSSYDVPEGYIIIRGVEGEYYPCEPNIFDKTYDYDK